jgi:hypothetical protein
MFKKIVETLVGGAIGLTALYVVAKVSFTAGMDVAEAEFRRDAAPLQKDAPDDIPDQSEEVDEVEEVPDRTVPERPQNKLEMLLGFRKLLGRKNRSVLGGLVNDPEDHTLEAYINEGEVHINIKRRKKRKSGTSQTLTEGS